MFLYFPQRHQTKSLDDGDDDDDRDSEEGSNKSNDDDDDDHDSGSSSSDHDSGSSSSDHDSGDDDNSGTGGAARTEGFLVRDSGGEGNPNTSEEDLEDYDDEAPGQGKGKGQEESWAPDIVLEDDLDQPMTPLSRPQLPNVPHKKQVITTATVHHPPPPRVEERPVLGQLSPNIPGAIPEYLPSLVSAMWFSSVFVMYTIGLLCISRDNWETYWNIVWKTMGTLFGKLEEHNLTVYVSLAGCHVHFFWYESGGLRGRSHHSHWGQR